MEFLFTILLLFATRAPEPMQPPKPECSCIGTVRVKRPDPPAAVRQERLGR